MKILVISDTHLDLPFEEDKYRFLEHIIKPVDRVVINGDFWEGYHMSFPQFIESPWKHLFPLLKEKQAVYLYGNHDQKKLIDKAVKLFSTTQTKQFTYKLKNKIYVFEHGNRLCPFFDEDPKQLHSVNGILQKYVGGRIERPATRLLKLPKAVQVFGRKKNKMIKKKLKNELKKNEIYVCGHTHGAEVDLENQFVNSGCIIHGLAQYLIIDAKGVTPKQEWYR